MSDKDFVNKYLEDFSSLVKPDNDLTNQIINAKEVLINAKKIMQKL